MSTKREFVSACGGVMRAMNKEAEILAAERRCLPSCAVAVLEGAAPSVEYWTWLISHLVSPAQPRIAPPPVVRAPLCRRTDTRLLPLLALSLFSALTIGLAFAGAPWQHSFITLTLAFLSYAWVTK